MFLLRCEIIESQLFFSVNLNKCKYLLSLMLIIAILLPVDLNYAQIAKIVSRFQSKSTSVCRMVRSLKFSNIKNIF